VFLRPYRWPGLCASVIALGLLCTSSVFAANPAPDLVRAGQLVRDGSYQEAYVLLAPFEETSQGDDTFNLLLGQAALKTNHPDKALTSFERSLAAAPHSVEAHLGLGRAYLAVGNYARAKIEFENVLYIENLPPDLHQQVEIYAGAAQAYAEKKRLLPSGYAMVGAGNHRVNDTKATDAFGGSDRSGTFISLRGGAMLNYLFTDTYSLNSSLDYRFRDYDNEGRRNDSDLRWNSAVSHTSGESNLAAGVRGRLSYRGSGQYRNDYGIYGNWRYRLDPDNQFIAGAEFRRRDYPNGPLRSRSRNIAELTGGWTRSLFGGGGSFSLVSSGGREFATDNRIDGDSSFFGLSPTLRYTLTNTLGGFVFGWWQHQRYENNRLNLGANNTFVGFETRNDNLYEAGGGLNWQFTQNCSLNPEIKYAHDESNIIIQNYSSTEIFMTLRVDF
jgi:tetratricopeptide (TPR) repeat protein